MRHLQREIHLRQTMVLEDRQLLAAHASALQQRTLQALATPKALLASFGAGFTAALLLGRRKQSPDSSKDAAGPSWLHLLLRDVAMPMAMDALQTKLGGSEQPDQ